MKIIVYYLILRGLRPKIYCNYHLISGPRRLRDLKFEIWVLTKYTKKGFENFTPKRPIAKTIFLQKSQSLWVQKLRAL